MSKTIDLQIEKSRVLIDGIRKNLGVLEDKGFNNEELDLMCQELDALKAANDECDAMREQLSAKVKNMNTISCPFFLRIVAFNYSLLFGKCIFHPRKYAVHVLDLCRQLFAHSITLVISGL